MSTRNDQGQYRELQLMITLLSLLEQNGVDVAFEMVHGDQRLFERERERFGIADADQQGSRQSGALGDGDGIDRFVSVLCFGESLANHRYDRAEMLTGCQFRDNAAIGLMGGDLRRDNIGNQLLTRADYGRRGFVAGTLDPEDVGVGHVAILFDLSIGNLSDTREMEAYLSPSGQAL